MFAQVMAGGGDQGSGSGSNEDPSLSKCFSDLRRESSESGIDQIPPFGCDGSRAKTQPVHRAVVGIFVKFRRHAHERRARERVRGVRGFAAIPRLRRRDKTRAAQRDSAGGLGARHAVGLRLPALYPCVATDSRRLEGAMLRIGCVVGTHGIRLPRLIPRKPGL